MKNESRMYFSMKALIIKDKKFLALYAMRDGKLMWDMPGGTMEFGESPEETLHREIMEELGVIVKPIKLVDMWHHIKEGKNAQISGVIYHCKVDNFDFKISSEHDGYEWIDISNFRDVFHSNIFSNRMLNWNWDLVLDETTLFKKDY